MRPRCRDEARAETEHDEARWRPSTTQTEREGREARDGDGARRGATETQHDEARRRDPARRRRNARGARRATETAHDEARRRYPARRRRNARSATETAHDEARRRRKDDAGGARAARGAPRNASRREERVGDGAPRSASERDADGAHEARRSKRRARRIAAKVSLRRWNLAHPTRHRAHARCLAVDATKTSHRTGARWGVAFCAPTSSTFRARAPIRDASRPTTRARPSP